MSPRGGLQFTSFSRRTKEVHEVAYHTLVVSA